MGAPGTETVRGRAELKHGVLKRNWPNRLQTGGTVPSSKRREVAVHLLATPTGHENSKAIGRPPTRGQSQ